MRLVIRPRFFTRPKRLAFYKDQDFASLMKKEIYGKAENKLTFDGEKLTLKTQIYLPVWKYPPETDQEDIEEWERFIKALNFHEKGHVEISKHFVKRLYRTLKKAPSSQRFALFHEAHEQLEALQEAYDLQTDHGRKQETPYGSTTIRIRQ